MNIQEATKKASEVDGGGIARPISDGVFDGYWYIPTNGTECVIVMNEHNECVVHRWNPTMEDLISSDWKVVTKSLTYF